MIEKISVTNFKSHAHTEIELGRVTALVGPNGCGKTSLLQSILVLNQMVRQMVTGSWNWDAVHSFIRKGQSLDSIRISVTGQEKLWGIKLFGDNITDLQGQHEIPPIAKLFGQVIYFKAISRRVSEPSYATDIPPKLGDDGTNTGSVISDLKTSQEEVYERIECDLIKIVPLVKRIRVHRVPKVIKEKRTFAANGNSFVYDEDRQVDAQELIFDTISGDRLPASMVSEGTLLTLALLTILHTSDASLFLLDDIEQGLHPLAQMKLMQILKDFAEKFDRQIIVTSHSPYVVDALKPEDVWVMATDDQGISHCRRLSEHPNIANARDVLTTGEIWSAEGEDWVTKPVQAEAVNA